MTTYYKHTRKSLRLTEYDYSQSGYYFITICTHNKACLFGTIKNGEIELNEAGKMIQSAWHDIFKAFPLYKSDSFIVMPNHVHGILIKEKFRLADTISLPEIMRNYKSITTVNYIRGIKENRYASFDKKLWQRNYYEHIIRNNESLSQIRQYIIDNPVKWDEDRENPLWQESKI